MSDPSDEFSIASATGVDVAIAIAGPGTRSYAFLIDWHIRVLLALAWFAVVALLALGHLLPTQVEFSDARPYLVLGLTLPPALIYFLYHPILEIAMRGRTPGKRMAGVRIVTTSGGVPSAGALLIRNVFRLIDMLPGMYLVGLLSSIATAKRVRVGDLAAGTLLAFDRSAELKSLAELGARAGRSRLPTAALEVLGDLLERWPALESDARRELALTLLARLEPDADRAARARDPDERLRERLRSLLDGGSPP